MSTDPSALDKLYGPTIWLLKRIAAASNKKWYVQYMNIYPALHGTLYFPSWFKVGAGGPHPRPRLATVKRSQAFQI